ncbi:MAG: AraC family transcriptional regulator [Burkholderiaceae bacterium]|nr:AraC family transcriptional regulator [Burkholderiaceae bacterium]
MHRVLRYVDDNLAAPLELAELASVANFSAFHFHRLFAAWTGERVGDYVRRRRLEVAAIRLVTQPASTVLEVALSVGFGSSEAFSRSFKLRFAESPSVWRTLQRNQRLQNAKMDQHESNPDQVSVEPVLQDGNHRNPLKEPIMDVQLKSLEPAEIAYLRHIGPYGAPIAEFWITEVAPWMKANGLMNAGRYGISHDDPSVTDAGKCRYDACVEVPASMALSGHAQRAILPGGRYATMYFKGSPEEIGEAWTCLLRDWLPSSGMQMDERPCFEYYPADRADGQSAQAFSCEICIPVTEL